MRYYQTKIKDLTDKELHDFLLKNNIDIVFMLCKLLVFISFINQ